MQTVPSLIGTGTAVAAAATGLIFGEPADGQFPPPSPRSHSNKRTPAHETLLDRSALSPRPGTTDSVVAIAESFAQFSLAQQPGTPTAAQPRMPRRSSQAQITPPKPPSSWRYSYGKQGDVGAAPVAEDARDSVSSNSSWMRRLSLRPLSQHESARSSLGPDTQSMFSHGSAAPILSPNSLTAPQPPRNKLVKRSSTRHGADPGPIIRRGSKSQMPTLRRPATSHQRSATLHQLTVEAAHASAKPSLETQQQQQQQQQLQQTRPRAKTLAAPPCEPLIEVPATHEFRWKSFFHSKVARIATKSSSKKSDGTVQQLGEKRVCVEQKGYQKAYLITPRSIMASPVDDEMIYASAEPDTSAEVEDSPKSTNKTGSSPEASPSKTPRRSISMQFSSPTSWISKTGSIRRKKRGAGNVDVSPTNKRYASDPLTSTTNAAAIDTDASDKSGANETLDDPSAASKVETDLAAIFQPPHGKRSASSPLPPLSRLSSFHIDLNRLGTSGNQGKLEDAPAASLSPSSVRVNSNMSQALTLNRASTVASSEYHRGFMSGEDDDTTGTPYDSLRTAGSGRRRTLDSPLESMFDESPPSTAGNAKQPKRLSIQEILGPAFVETGSKIMEEDESLPTPVRATYDDAEVHFRLSNIEQGQDYKFPANKSSLTLASRELERLSLDDDDDLDWARDEEDGVYNRLSPPGSMNSRKGSPNYRPALTMVSGNSARDTSSERPRSNVFDWAESKHHERHESDGHYLRPKTVHGKKELDMRGGRAASRRTPVPLHVRSQSVPVVPGLNPADSSKATPKFGTWGLGSKNVSEDWDEDFEFEDEVDASRPEGRKAENRVSMVVPASIQATQPTVRAHSGQIRELSLLVNDLKRLCRLGRELDMLSGSYPKLWREAEGIIALASPEEDQHEDEVSNTSTDVDFNVEDERFVDEGFDGGVLDHDHLSKFHTQLKTAVVKERFPARRRSVFSPEDDIFGNWPHTNDDELREVPRTPEQNRPSTPYNPASVARSLMESMHLRRKDPTDADYDEGDCSGRLNFDTNSLKELVKRAGDLRDSLSDLVRRADHLTSSPMRTPRRERVKNEDGSPAFTRMFEDPASTPTSTRPLPLSRSSTSGLSSGSMTASPSNGINQRMQMMTVS
ncbi:hypothetical protein BKA67DRAFT_404777 [Truncatella angustata]|uniref:Uncharacterized protein n=1 Tax=Truncatella angustata TaxID=152316 RepID=A0A9P8UDS6_9PEZI|nr:uncharacterized protein BKA67DRAFT_404777 [Truncatella angustata]KAH6648071.1 hypothetical protein BKA67DRAFT_404777 [Truncatella angustata]